MGTAAGLCAACANPDAAEPAYFDHAELQLERLDGELLARTPALALPALLRVSGPWLWVADHAGDPGLHRFDLRSGEHVWSGGRGGMGPGELSGRPFGLLAASDDSGGVWAWDVGRQQLILFAPDAEDGAGTATVAFADEALPQFGRMVRDGSDGWVGVAGSDESRFALFLSDGSLRRTVAVPLPGPNDAPHSERVRAMQEAIHVCAWPGRGFVVVHLGYGRIEYYDSGGSLVRTAAVPFPSEPTFRFHEPSGTLRFDWPRSYYVGCTVAVDRLFALFSGRLGAAYERESAWSAEFVHVFDWEGDLVEVYRLGEEIVGIDVSVDGSLLYGGSMTEAGIYVFPVRSSF